MNKYQYLIKASNGGEPNANKTSNVNTANRMVKK